MFETETESHLCLTEQTVLDSETKLLDKNLGNLKRDFLTNKREGLNL
jgi:hypothetical protein